MEIERSQAPACANEAGEFEQFRAGPPREWSQATALDALTALGPILLVRPPAHCAQSDDLARCLQRALSSGAPVAVARVEAGGVLEMLMWGRDAAPTLLVRLPETDFGAWERLCAFAAATERVEAPASRAHWSQSGNLTRRTRATRAWWATPVCILNGTEVGHYSVRVSLHASVLAWRVWEALRCAFDVELRVCATAH